MFGKKEEEKVGTEQEAAPVKEEKASVDTTASKKSEPIDIKADKDGLVTVEIKVYVGAFKFGGAWYDLKVGKHKVPKAVRDALKARGDLG